MNIIKEYNNSFIQDLGTYGASHIIYALGVDEGLKHIEYALKNKCYIALKYSETEIDKVDRIEFRFIDGDRLYDEIEL